MPKPEEVAQEQSSGEDAKLLRQKRRFVKTRKAFVKAYLRYRDEKLGREPGGHEYIMKEVDAMLRYVESWKWLQEKQGVPACFEQKCELILDATKKLSNELHRSDDVHVEQEERYEMIVVHIGALDVDGYTDDDKFAVKWAKEIELMHQDWHTMPALAKGGREYLFDIWNDLHAKFDGCGCRLCMYVYTGMKPPPAKWSSRPPTPQLGTPEPPSSPDSSEWSSSSEGGPAKGF